MFIEDRKLGKILIDGISTVSRPTFDRDDNPFHPRFKVITAAGDSLVLSVNELRILRMFLNEIL